MNNIHLSENEMAMIFLDDDKTPYGGISYENETLHDFCTELGLLEKSVAEINKALKETGIKPITVKETKCDVGSYLTVGRNQYIIRKEYSGQGYHFKSIDNFYHHKKLPCYSAEYQEIDEYYTAEEILTLADGNENLATDLFETVDWQHIETLMDEWDRIE